MQDTKNATCWGGGKSKGPPDDTNDTNYCRSVKGGEGKEVGVGRGGGDDVRGDPLILFRRHCVCCSCKYFTVELSGCSALPAQ